MAIILEGMPVAKKIYQEIVEQMSRFGQKNPSLFSIVVTRMIPHKLI